MSVYCDDYKYKEVKIFSETKYLLKSKPLTNFILYISDSRPTFAQLRKDMAKRYSEEIKAQVLTAFGGRRESVVQFAAGMARSHSVFISQNFIKHVIARADLQSLASCLPLS